MKKLLRIKDQGVLSAESIVTVKVAVESHILEDEPAFFQVQITAAAMDLDLFLLPYDDDDVYDVEVDIIDVIQPYIGKHDDNLKWLDYVKKREGIRYSFGDDEVQIIKETDDPE